MKLWTKVIAALAAIVLTASPTLAVNVDHLADLCDAGKQNACRELARHAEQDKDLGVRIEAVKRLTDQTVLARVAMEDHDSNAREAAVEKLTDQTVLAKVAMEEHDSPVRKAAVERLTDQTVLAKVAIEEHDSRVRQAAARRLTNQAVLTKLVKEESDWDVREAAVGNLTDQTLLANVSMTDSDSKVRQIAYMRLTDPTALTKVAIEGSEFSQRLAALNRITDQRALARITREAKDPPPERDCPGQPACDSDMIRWRAVEMLTDQTVLVNAAMEDHNQDVRKAAVNRITDQSALIKVVLRNGWTPGETGNQVLGAAMAKLTDESLASLALMSNRNRSFLDVDDSLIYTRIDAVSKMTNPALLLKVFREADDESVRSLAVLNMTDEAALAKIAKEENSSKARESAITNRYLNDPAVIAAAALQDPSLTVRSAAIARTLDESVLAKVASTEADGDLREGARLQLALWNPIINKKTPNVIVTIRRERISNNSYGRVGKIYTMGMGEIIEGEKVSIKISAGNQTRIAPQSAARPPAALQHGIDPRGGTLIASDEWESEWPEKTTSRFIPVILAKVNLVPLLVRFLREAQIPPAELRNLAQHADCPELRAAAVAASAAH